MTPTPGQTGPVACNLLQCDLPWDTSIYMVGSSHASLLHIINASTVSRVRVLKKFQNSNVVKWCLGFHKSHVCCEQAWLPVNASVVLHCYYFVTCLWCISHVACLATCKRTLTWLNQKWGLNIQQQLSKMPTSSSAAEVCVEFQGGMRQLYKGLLTNGSSNLNSLSPGRLEWNFRQGIFKLISLIYGCG